MLVDFDISTLFIRYVPREQKQFPEITRALVVFPFNKDSASLAVSIPRDDKIPIDETMQFRQQL